jgi:LacI family transcriptional regulator
MESDVVTNPPPQEYSEAAVAAIVEERIRHGIYAPGSRVPAERVLAEELGVSRRFVRMAYTRLIEQGLLEKSHYRRPIVPITKGLTRFSPPRRTGDASTVKTIAAILPSHPVFPGGLSIVAGIHRILTDLESEYRLTFFDTFHKDRPEVLRREAKAIKQVIDEGIPGLILWYYSPEQEVLDLVRSHPELQIVFIDRHPANLNCDFAGIDDVDSSRAAVEYLMDLGHTRIAHLMDPGNYSTILERAQGYREAYMARGLPYDERLALHLDWDERRMEKAFDYFYSLPDPPTALFASNDFIAHEFILVAEERGKRIPDDLSVVGHGNMDRYTPRQFLTTVDQPFETIGKTAAKLLLKRLEQQDDSAAPPSFQQVILQAPLVVRKSCRRLNSH